MTIMPASRELACCGHWRDLKGFYDACTRNPPSVNGSQNGEAVPIR